MCPLKSQEINFKSSQLQNTLPSLEAAAQARRLLVIIASEVLAASILKQLRGELQIAVAKFLTFGDNRITILRDSTGGTILLDTMLLRAAHDLLVPTESIITKEDTIILYRERSKVST